jgi:hypothetical protein
MPNNVRAATHGKLNCQIVRCLKWYATHRRFPRDLSVTSLDRCSHLRIPNAISNDPQLAHLAPSHEIVESGDRVVSSAGGSLEHRHSVRQ